MPQSMLIRHDAHGLPEVRQDAGKLTDLVSLHIADWERQLDGPFYRWHPKFRQFLAGGAVRFSTAITQGPIDSFDDVHSLFSRRVVLVWLRFPSPQGPPRPYWSSDTAPTHRKGVRHDRPETLDPHRTAALKMLADYSVSIPMLERDVQAVENKINAGADDEALDRRLSTLQWAIAEAPAKNRQDMAVKVRRWRLSIGTGEAVWDGRLAETLLDALAE